MGKFSAWRDCHPDLWELILFDMLSNVSTVTRLVMTWVGTAVLVTALGLTRPFSLFIFDYTSAGSGGLGGFLTFLAAEALAQVVNFVVQKRWVFRSNAAFSKAAPRFAVLAVVIVVVNLVLPGHVTSFCQSLGMASGVATTVASVVNTLLAVVVSYPLLKFWVMPSK